MSTSQRIIKNTLFLYIRMAISILVNIFTTRILLEALGASDYGLYNVVGGAIAMLGFVTSSMSSTTQRFISYAEGEGNFDKIKSIFANALIVHYGVALFTAVLLIFAGLVFFNGILNIPEGREGSAILIYGCMVFSTVFSITVVPYDASLNAHENMKIYSSIGIADVLFKLLIAVTVFYFDSDRLILYGVLMALESWFVRLITQQYCKKHYSECQDLCLQKLYEKNTIREMTSFAGWNMIEIFSSMVSLYGMSLIVNHFFGTELNAALGIATQLAGVLMGISMNMIKAITPILVKREGMHQREQMLELSYVGCKFSYLSLSFFCIPVIFYINEILDIWLYDVPVYTSVFCQIFVISNLIEQLSRLLYQTIMARGHIQKYNIVRSIANIMPIILSVFMLKFWTFPPYWILLNWLLWRVLIGGMINVFYANKEVGLSVGSFLKRVVNVCALTSLTVIFFNVCLVLLQEFFFHKSIFFFFISIIISIPIYWYISISKQEKYLIVGFVKNKSLMKKSVLFNR